MVGWAGWVCAWVFENKSDRQKKAYLWDCAEMGKKLKAEGKDKELAELKLAVLG